MNKYLWIVGGLLLLLFLFRKKSSPIEKVSVSLVDPETGLDWMQVCPGGDTNSKQCVWTPRVPPAVMSVDSWERRAEVDVNASSRNFGNPLLT